MSTVSKTGGHLASNLGVVELTLALHYIFNTPTDKIVWDVGHQAYTHKIITGRKNSFHTLRQQGGISGFPKPCESEYDCFGAGHSSTSISAALGIARARDLKGEKHKVIAVIGDGALTGGMAFEALNDAGQSKNDLIVILNDNEMSISKNVGAVSVYLSRIRTRKTYFKVKYHIERLLERLPKGERITSLVRRLKNSIKQIFIQQTIFDELGFIYLGPIDGNDIAKTIKMLSMAKELDHPVLIHLSTRKGKGYDQAEVKPHAYHGISKFDIESGTVIRDKVRADYSAIFGRNLTRLAKTNPRIVAISPAMPLGSGLKPFIRNFPDRFFDVGIAEEHAVTMAAGLAVGGYVPVVAIYSTFLQRAYDQILHDVAIQKLHVVFAIDRAGAVGDDGETHQGMFDIAFLNTIPNMTILAPSSFRELAQMLDYSINRHNGPIAIRYPRGNMCCSHEGTEFEPGRAQIVSHGSDISIIAVGNMVKNAYEASRLLVSYGVRAEVVSLRTIKPLDERTIIASALKTGKAIVVEDGIKAGGVGSLIATLFVREGLDIELVSLGYDDVFVKQASVKAIHEKFGLDAASITALAVEMAKPGLKAVK